MESAWLDPAAACSMWVELWTAWYVAALSWWLPGPALRGSIPARPYEQTLRARMLAVKAPCAQDRSIGAAHNGIDRQVKNGYGAG